MNNLVYDREQLKVAVSKLLDRRYGEARTKVIRSIVKGPNRMSYWFSGRRKVLRIFRDIAEQPTGKIRVLDLLDSIDRKRTEILRQEAAEAPEALRKLSTQIRDCTRRYRQRESAAILTERIRREAKGEPQMTPEETKEFLKKRREYWLRRSKELVDAELQKPEVRHISVIKAEVANTVLKEELDRLRKAKEGIYKLSDAAQRRLRGSYYKKQWERTADK